MGRIGRQVFLSGRRGNRSSTQQCSDVTISSLAASYLVVADTGPRKQEIVVNEANVERIGRLAAGVVLLILGFTALSGVLAVIAVIAGLILTVTGAIGWCPIYSILKIGTRKITGA